MDTINNTLYNFNSIVDHMSKCINDKFIKIMKLCKDLDPNGNYYLKIVNKDKTWEQGFNPFTIGKKWYVNYGINNLPCKFYEESIYGMSTSEVADFYSKPYEVIIYDLNMNQKEIIRERI